jgi:diguanylate cyclase (GGDEF)-like protein
MFQTTHGILIEVDGAGLSEVTSHGPELIAGGDIFVDKPISTLVEFPDGSQVAVVHKPQSLWMLREKDDPTRIASIEPDVLMKQVGIGLVVAPNQMALPEDNGGVAILGINGRLADRIDPSDLGVGTGAQALLVDREGALWIAWRSAISRIEYPSRTRVFPLPSALFGQSLPLTRTNLGLTTFHGSTVLTLRQIDHQDRWEFQQHGEFLSPIMIIRSIGGLDFAGTISGIWSLQDGSKAVSDDLVFSAAAVIGHDDEIWVGLRNGLSKLKRHENRWSEVDRTTSISFDAISVLQTEPQALWVGSLVGRVARVKLKEASSLASGEFEEFGQSAGLPKATISLEQVGDDTLFWAQGGQFYEFNGGRFLPSRIIPAQESGPIQDVKRVDEAQLLISNPNSRLRLLRRDITGVYHHQRSIFDEIASVEKTRSMHVDPDGIVWLAQDSNVVRIDPKADVPKPAPQQVLIRDVSVGDRSLLKGRKDGASLALDEGASLRVEYTLPSYLAPELNRFRSRIRPIQTQAEWSSWSNETRRDFTNLPAGELLFEVEAQDAAGGGGGVAAVPITVIAPWYRRTWAIAVFIVAGLMLVWMGVQWRLRALRARGAELERLVAIKTEALQVAANTDPLTGLWNRHRFGQWLRSELPDIHLRAAVSAPQDPADLIVCGIDLDHFKRINDQHGHAAGDAILKAVAARLQSLKRPNDLIFRFGGEEFVYIGMQRHRDEGRELAETIVREIAQVRVELEDGVLLEPTASVGWSGYPFYRERPDLFGLDFVLGVADRALYVAKQEGRHRACGFLPNLSVDDIDRTQADWRAQVFTRHPDFLKRVG